MDILKIYDHAASTWSKKAKKLGYTSAYAELFKEGVSQEGRVLDIGTGTGIFALNWVAAGGSKDLTLLDPSLQMLEQAKTSFAKCDLQPNLLNSKIEEFHSDGNFKVVLASHVIEHFDAPQDAFHKFAAFLEPGGELYLNISKPHWCNWIIWLRYRHQWYAPDVVNAMASQAGLYAKRIHNYSSGPPSRTSIGYVFTNSNLTDKVIPC